MTFLAVWTFLKGIFNAIPWKVWVAIIAFALVATAFKIHGDRRYEDGQAERQGLWDAANTLAEQQNRAKEDGWRKGISDYATKVTQERLTRERQFAAIVDGLQSGNGPVRVRPRLKCNLPKAPGTASGNDGSPTGPSEPAGFQESDAIVVLRIGEDADSVASRLAQCQHYVRTVSGS